MGCKHKCHKHHHKHSHKKSIYDKVQDSIVTLGIFNEQDDPISSCSGAIISSDGLILTAAHCLTQSNPDTRFAKIYALVTNFNRTGKAHLLLCDILGVDGEGDIGVAKIQPQYGMNKQRYLKWGDSLSVKHGDKCYVIGDPKGEDYASVSEGVVRDPSYVENSGGQQLESILVTAPGFPGNSGSAILDKCGRIIGVYTFGSSATTETLGGGATQRMAQPVAQWIIDNQTDYYLRRGRFGLTSPIPLLATNAPLLGYEGLDFDFRGIAVTDIKAGAPVLSATIPLQEGDVITEVNGYKCGILDNQTAITTGYWHLDVGAEVNVKFLRPPSLVEQTTVVTTGPVPVAEDVPLSGNV